MLKNLAYATLLLITGVAVGVMVKPVTHISTHAKGGSMAFATLCNLGSFECIAAPDYTRYHAAINSAENALATGKLKKAEAQKVQMQGDIVLALLKQAKVVCKQNNKTGQCQGDEAQAKQLVLRAEDVLAAEPLSTFVPIDLRKVKS